MRSVEVYDRQGRVIIMPSVVKTAREMGLCPATIRRRIKDRHWILREGYAAVRVRYHRRVTAPQVRLRGKRNTERFVF